MKRKKPLFYIILIALFTVAIIPFAIYYLIYYFSSDGQKNEQEKIILHNTAVAANIGVKSSINSYLRTADLLTKNLASHNGETATAKALLNIELKNNPNILALAIIDNSGSISASSSRLPHLLVELKLSKYIKDYQQQLTTVTTVDGMVIPIITTLQKNNKFLLTVISGDILTSVINGLLLAPGTILEIITRDGLIAASSHTERSGTHSKNSKIIDNIYSQENGYIKAEDPLNNEQTPAYTIPLRLTYYPTNLGIVASRNSYSNSPYITFQSLHMSVTFISLLLSVFIGSSLLYRYISDPINQVIKMITYVHSGIFNYELKHNRCGEFGELLRAFNEMMNNLEKRFLYQKRMRQEILLRNRYEEKLKTSRAEALSLSKAKDEFLANISHEIRTPLNAIIGYSEKIMLEHPNEPFSKNIKTILDESDHLLLLLNDLLDNAKIDADKLDLEYIPSDLHKCLEQSTESSREAARKKKLSFSLNISKNTPRHVVFDPLRFRQVLANLLSNAIKFTEKGAITVQTEVLKTTPDHAEIKFSVIDTGIGIAKDKQQSIFNEFSQADGSTTRKYGGTGLGTTISKKLVTLMGGEMCLESEPGKGSIFWFTLNLSTAISESDMIKISMENTETITDNANKFSGTILVAEDYEVNQDLIRSQLEYLGLNVLIADNGRIAVDECKRIFFDLIFMDLQMPEMGGIEAARRIRIDYPHYEKVPIIALTANADKDIKNICRAVGMNGILNKPTHIDELATSLMTWLPKSCHISPISISEKSKEKYMNNSLTKNPDDNSGSETTDNNTPEIQAPVDFTEASRLFGNNTMVFNMALKNFLESASKNIIPDLNESFEIGNTRTLRQGAHKLKGGAASVTARKLSQLSGELEKRSDTGDEKELQKLIKDIEDEFELVQKYVRSYLNE